MEETSWKTLVAVSFLIASALFASVAAFTTLFYRNRPVHDLSERERDILYGRARLHDRLMIFLVNLLASVIAPPVYITTIILAGILWLLLG